MNISILAVLDNYMGQRVQHAPTTSATFIIPTTGPQSPCLIHYCVRSLYGLTQQIRPLVICITVTVVRYLEFFFTCFMAYPRALDRFPDQPRDRKRHRPPTSPFYCSSQQCMLQQGLCACQP